MGGDTGKVLGEPARGVDHPAYMGVGGCAGERVRVGAIPEIRLLPEFSGISDKLLARQIHRPTFVGRDSQAGDSLTLNL